MDANSILIGILIANTIPPVTTMEPWWGLLMNGGTSVGLLCWFMWRDGKEREKRDAEHAENYRIQRENIDALNLMTQAQMAYLLTLKQLDESTRDLASKIKQQADSEIAAHQK
jgi:hypothetical protein